VPPALKVRPPGRLPAPTDHRYGAIPPVAARVWEYATPTTPAGSEELVMTSGGGAMASVRGAVALAPVESVTCTVKLADPTADGVPEIVPDALNARVAGRVPDVTDHV
jgi:hypothetical protein